jgi:hypothetical protein
MTRDWWDTPPTRIHMRFTADQIHADTDGNTARIQLDDGQNQVTLHPTDAAALIELHNLIDMLIEQQTPTVTAEDEFTDPTTGQTHVITDDPNGPRIPLGVQHPECDKLADIYPDINGFWCRHCGHVGQINGDWITSLVPE